MVVAVIVWRADYRDWLCRYRWVNFTNYPRMRYAKGFAPNYYHQWKEEYSSSALESQPDNAHCKWWWSNVKLLLVQTAALGPSEFLRSPEHQPDFRGCRHITVNDGVIEKVKYIKHDDIGNYQPGTFDPHIFEFDRSRVTTWWATDRLNGLSICTPGKLPAFVVMLSYFVFALKGLLFSWSNIHGKRCSRSFEVRQCNVAF